MRALLLVLAVAGTWSMAFRLCPAGGTMTLRRSAVSDQVTGNAACGDRFWNLSGDLVGDELTLRFQTDDHLAKRFLLVATVKEPKMTGRVDGGGMRNAPFTAVRKERP